MAIDIFLKLTGISGESTNPDHVGEIELLGWNWGAPSGQTNGGQGGQISRANLNRVTLTKGRDMSSVALAKAAATGASIDTGVLTVHERGGDDIVVLTLQDIRVADVSVTIDKRGDALEQVSIVYTGFTSKSAAHAHGPPALNYGHASSTP